MSKQWNSSVQFNLDNYLVRVVDATFGPSKSSGKPMITLTTEIVSPDTMNVAGEDYNVAGVKVRPMYIVTKSVDADGNVDVEKTSNIKTRLDELTKAFGLPAITDPENPDIEGFKGKIVWALVGSETVERRKAPTAEQLAKGEKVGEVLTNPMTGQPLVNYFPKIQQIFGQPSEDVIRQATGK